MGGQKWGKMQYGVGFTRQPESPNVHTSGSRPSKTPPKFHEKTPREREKKNENGGGRGKKNAKFWASHPSPLPSFGSPTLLRPTLRGRNLRSPSSMFFFVSCVTFYFLPNCCFFVPFVFFVPKCTCLFCPDGRLLILSPFRFFFFVPTPGIPETRCRHLGPGRGGKLNAKANWKGGGKRVQLAGDSQETRETPRRPPRRPLPPPATPPPGGHPSATPPSEGVGEKESESEKGEEGGSGRGGLKGEEGGRRGGRGVKPPLMNPEARPANQPVTLIWRHPMVTRLRWMVTFWKPTAFFRVQ